VGVWTGTTTETAANVLRDKKHQLPSSLAVSGAHHNTLSRVSLFYYRDIVSSISHTVSSFSPPHFRSHHHHVPKIVTRLPYMAQDSIEHILPLLTWVIPDIERVEAVRHFQDSMFRYLHNHLTYFGSVP
jgi:hypothetical protein